MNMRTTLLSCLLVSTLSIPAMAVEKTAETSEKPKPSLTEAVTKIITASVTAIDYKTRIVSLKGLDGSIQDVHVSHDVKDLQQFKVGDQVTSEVIETMSVYARKNDGSKPVRKESETIHVSRPGEEPMKVQVNIEEMIAEVADINMDTRQINLKLPNGLLQTCFVPRFFAHLDNVRKGDQVVVRHSKTTVIKVLKVDRPGAAKTATSKGKPKVR